MKSLIDILNDQDDKYSYFVRFIDCFFDLSEEQQMGLLSWIVEDVGSEKWERLVDDVYSHPALVKMILYHYSSFDSSALNKDPSPKDLAAIIQEYMKSSAYKTIEKANPKPFISTFTDLEEA